jgi:two-component system chemotaxis response regulator CheB
MTERPADALHVLVVDDSAVVRRFMSTVLVQDRGTTVETASDPFIAMRKMQQRRPDVIILDVEMPRMDGLTFLRKIMAEDPIPVVICSGHAGRGTRTALEALRHGAVDIITKPSHGVREFLQESAVMLLDAVRAAAHARLRKRSRVSPEPRLSADAVLSRSLLPKHRRGVEKLVAIGASTGGPEALRRVLGEMPLNAPSIVAVQHMPAAFTGAFAKNLNESSVIDVKEAENGDRVRPGGALIAPGDRHMMVVRHGQDLTVRLIDGPLVSRHRPSVDVLFRSVAQTMGPDSVGVLMTGMGDDGVQGLLEMRQAGAATVAQDEGSCVVFGMPKEAVERGAAAAVAPLSKIAVQILRRASGAAESSRAGSGVSASAPRRAADHNRDLKRGQAE